MSAAEKCIAISVEHYFQIEKFRGNIYKHLHFLNEKEKLATRVFHILSRRSLLPVSL